MLVETTEKNGYLLLDIKKETFSDKDFIDIRELFDSYLVKGVKKIALEFSADAYPYSKLITLLVQCDTMAKKAKVEFAVIQPNEEFYEVISGTNLTHVVKLLSSEEELV